MRPLREEWESHADEWATFARRPGHDTFYWHYNEPAFLGLLPPPGRLTLDVGCGEGRLARALVAAGHTVLGVDGSEALGRLALDDDERVPVANADAARLPIADASADLVVSCMVLMDVEQLDEAVIELARVLDRRGVLCVALLHPIQTAGLFIPGDANHTFYLGEYRRPMRHEMRMERDGVGMTFFVEHRPLEAYSRAFERAGLVIVGMREPVPSEDAVAAHPEMADYRRVPSFLYLVARRA